MTCEHCGKLHPIMLTMTSDSGDWSLCSPCYREMYKIAEPEDVGALESLSAEIQINRAQGAIGDDKGNKPPGVQATRGTRGAAR